MAQRSFLLGPLQHDLHWACEAEFWLEAPPRATAAVEAIFACVCTKIIEDAWQRSRSVEERAQASKTMHPQCLWINLAQRKVASSVHAFPEVNFKEVPDRVAVPLPKVPDKSLYAPKRSKASVPLSSLVCTKDPDWYSPSPSRSVAQ